MVSMRVVSVNLVRVVADSHAMGAVAAAPPAVPTLTAVFVDSTGRLCRGPLSEVWATPFVHAAPVRPFPSFPGAGQEGLSPAPGFSAEVGPCPWLGRAAVGFPAERELVLLAFLFAEELEPACRWQALDQFCGLRWSSSRA